MLQFRTLLETGDVSFGHVLCSTSMPDLSDEEAEPAFSVSFPTTGTYVRHVGNDRVVANPATAVFFNSGEIHRVSHPSGTGDINIFAVLSDDLAEPFLSPQTSRFPMMATPLPARSHLTVRILEHRATNGMAGALEVEETIIGLIRQLLRSDPSSPQGTHRSTALAADAAEYLGVHYSEDASLRNVANAVGSSPHHLSRVFKSSIGLTLSEYRTQLRIRAAIEQLAQGAEDLTSVAIGVGFYDHSHLTRTMKRHLATTPSRIREQLRPAA